MKLLALSLISLFLFTSALGYDMIKDEAWVKNYFNNLKKSYDKRVGPMGENGPESPVKVAISMYILDISEVDDSSMDYTAQFYFRQGWNDSRLRYTDRSETLVLSDSEDIWTPDLFFTGGREGRLEHIVHPNKFLRISPRGEVLLSIRITVKFSCPMDLRYFPHDVQQCDLKFESYGHTKRYIDMVWNESFKSVGISEEITLHNFDVVGFDKSETVVNFTLGQYKVMNVHLTFQRKFGFFAIKLYVPFIILVIVSFISLWIKPEERGIRMTLLVIILYLMTDIAVEASHSIPPAPYTKGTDVWIGFCESLVFAVFLEFVAVALISGRDDNQISESKGEILLNMESDSKEQPLKSDTLKSHLSKLVNMFDARNGGKARRNDSAYRIDKIFRVVFPLTFILFNVVYWSVYCCKSVQ